MGSDRLIGIASRTTDVVLVLLIVLVVAVLCLGRGLPLTGHPVLVVGGPSMEPALPIGGVVILEPVAPEALAVGDVVTLRSGPARALFTHRITRIVERDGSLWIQTKGDANATADPAISPVSAVVGRVAWHAPAIGYAVALLSSFSGMVVVLAAGGALLLLGWLLDGLLLDRRVRRPTVGLASA